MYHLRITFPIPLCALQAEGVSCPHCKSQRCFSRPGLAVPENCRFLAAPNFRNRHIAMKYGFALISLILSGSFVWGQVPPSEGCAKNVSFAVAEDGQPVPAIPKFTLKWLGSKSRQEGFASLCFSQVPSLTQTNYLVVFSTN